MPVRSHPVSTSVRRLSVPNTCQSSAHPEGRGDAPPGSVLLAGDALGVDLQQHRDAVAGPLGDLRRGHAGVEPRRHRGVPQVVGAGARAATPPPPPSARPASPAPRPAARQVATQASAAPWRINSPLPPASAPAFPADCSSLAPASTANYQSPRSARASRSSTPRNFPASPRLTSATFAMPLPGTPPKLPACWPPQPVDAAAASRCAVQGTRSS